MKKVFTTGQVAKICKVAPRTVSKWFDTGRLRGYRIPGSQDRRDSPSHACSPRHGPSLNDCCLPSGDGKDAGGKAASLKRLGPTGHNYGSCLRKAGEIRQQFNLPAVLGEDVRFQAEIPVGSSVPFSDFAPSLYSARPCSCFLACSSL